VLEGDWCCLRGGEGGKVFRLWPHELRGEEKTIGAHFLLGSNGQQKETPESIWGIGRRGIEKTPDLKRKESNTLRMEEIRKIPSGIHQWGLRGIGETGNKFVEILGKMKVRFLK